MPKGNMPHRTARKVHIKDAATGTADMKRIAAVVIILVLAGIPFWFGKYFEFNFPDPFDSAANAYSAQRVLDGARIGIDERPSAALGTLLVNMLGVSIFGYSEFGPKMIQGIAQAIALVLMFLAARRAFGSLAAVVTVTVASVYLSAPLIAKFGNVKEQFMIACMMAAVSLVILRHTGGGWWYSLLAGAIASWAPLFKETGTSVIGAIGLFALAQPILGHRSWKQTGVDIGLLLGGAAAAMTPLYIWMLGWDVQMGLPYSFIWDTIGGFMPRDEAAQQAANYVTSLRSTIPFAEQWPKVLRFYWVLIVPVALAAGSIIVRAWQAGARLLRRQPSAPPRDGGRFVLLLGVWWVLDMAFVLISPASYEQYYLPLTASGAMAGGYIIGVYGDKLAKAVFKARWVVTGAVGLILMIIFSWHIFFGLSRSAYSGTAYPKKMHGYVQRYADIQMAKKQGATYPWEALGDYIKMNTVPGDKIYVWGWYPGIYVRAGRFSNAPQAFESEMHNRPPEQLEQIVDELLEAFRKDMPKYIVDSRKQHLPLDRDKFELWPIVPKGFMGFQETRFVPDDAPTVARFEKEWGDLERQKFGEEEARRFEVMGKFRKFIRDNYEVVQMFGGHVLLRLKKT